MTEFSLRHRKPGRTWAMLREDRFTNVDIVMVIGALLMAAFIGALAGATLLS